MHRQYLEVVIQPDGIVATQDLTLSSTMVREWVDHQMGHKLKQVKLLTKRRFKTASQILRS